MDLKEIITEVDDETSNFFRSLGFKVTWDFKRDTMKKWYELYLGDALIMQLDFGVPLAHVFEDLPLLAEGKPGTSTSDYTIYATKESLVTICRLITDQKGPPPWHGR